MASSRAPRSATAAPAVKWVLRLLVVGYLFFLVAWPTSLVVKHTFARRPAGHLTTRCSDPDVVHALKLTAQGGHRVGPDQPLFGVGMSLLLVRYEFPGKRALSR